MRWIKCQSSIPLLAKRSVGKSDIYNKKTTILKLRLTVISFEGKAASRHLINEIVRRLTIILRRRYVVSVKEGSLRTEDNVNISIVIVSELFNY